MEDAAAGKESGVQALEVLSLARLGKPDALWEAVKSSCRGALSQWGERCLRSGLDAKLGSVVAEPRYLCKDHRNLYSHFYSKKFFPGSPECTRLHFFSHPDVTDASFKENPSRFQDGYLGYSVIRPVAERCLGRTVFSASMLGLGKFCLSTDFKVQLRGRELKVAGFPYTSQDTDATVCAHSALWAACRYLSERYPAYREVHPYDLIEWTATNRGRRVPHRGMTYEDYSTILSAFGAHPEVLRLRREDEGQDLNQFTDLCAFVESGFPVLASIPRHVILIIGHTLDFSARHHPAYAGANEDPLGMVDCSAYWKQFVVVDDNAFPYARFGFEGDPENYRSGVWSIPDIHSVVVPLPEKAFLPAKDARKRTRGVFIGNPDLLAEARHDSNEPLITRLFLTNGASWKRRKIEAWSRSRADVLLSLAADFRLPHFVWVLQAAPLSLYSKGQCTAEIVLDATAGRKDTAELCGRVGNTLLFRGASQGAITSRKRFSGVPDTWELYRHNLGESP
jgi:hypothetical protein